MAVEQKVHAFDGMRVAAQYATRRIGEVNVVLLRQLDQLTPLALVGNLFPIREAQVERAEEVFHQALPTNEPKVGRQISEPIRAQLGAAVGPVQRHVRRKVAFRGHDQLLRVEMGEGQLRKPSAVVPHQQDEIEPRALARCPPHKIERGDNRENYRLFRRVVSADRLEEGRGQVLAIRFG